MVILQRVDSYYAVLVEEVLVSFDNYYKTLLAFESRFVFDKCAAVCESVALLLVGDIYCLEHSLSCLYIPLRLVKIFDSGFSEKLKFRRVSARFVSAAYKWQLLLRYCRHGFRDGLAFDSCRVICRADEDKVVVHNLAAVHSRFFCHELVFRRRVVCQNDIDISVASVVQGRSSSD